MNQTIVLYLKTKILRIAILSQINLLSGFPVIPMMV